MQTRFPFVGHLHRDAFLGWAATVGRHDERIPSELLPDVALSQAERVASQVGRSRAALERRLQSAAARYPSLRRGAPLPLGAGRAPVFFVLRFDMVGALWWVQWYLYTGTTTNEGTLGGPYRDGAW